MALARYLLPALAFVGTSLAQCSNEGTLTISASADASALASCTTYSGSVAIETGLSDIRPDQNGNQQLEVRNVERITGNLTVIGATKLSSLSFDSLESVGGFELGGLYVLAELSFPRISQVNQLNFTALPGLQNLDFGATGLTKAESILITNTGLTSLQGIDKLQSVDTFNVNNNQALQNISLQVTEIKNSLDIEANDVFASGLSTSFPLLETAKNMTFRNCSSISLPALSNVSEDLGFYGNTFTSFAAPNLTSTSGLVFVDNTELTNISLPKLTSINGTYQIANNTQLKRINGFTKLDTVTGALDFSGNFTDVELPALKQVKGAFNMQTSAKFDCSKFDEYESNKVIRGKYFCQGSEDKPGRAGSQPSGTSSSSSADETDAAVHFDANLPAVMGGTSLLVGILQLLF